MNLIPIPADTGCGAGESGDPDIQLLQRQMDAVRRNITDIFNTGLEQKNVSNNFFDNINPYFADGTKYDPGAAWDKERSSGWYRPSDTNFAYVIGATHIYEWNATEFRVNVTLKLADGAFDTPSLTFSNDTSTGRYRLGAGNVGESIGGTAAYDWNSTRIFSDSLKIRLGNTAGYNTRNWIEIDKNVNDIIQYGIRNQHSGNSAAAQFQAQNNGGLTMSCGVTSGTWVGLPHLANEGYCSAGSGCTLLLSAGSTKSIRFAPGNTVRATVNAFGDWTLQPTDHADALDNYTQFTYTAPSETFLVLTSKVEWFLNFGAGIKQYDTGGTANLAVGLEISYPLFDSTTAGLEITDAATVRITGAPTAAGPNVTILNPYGLWVQDGGFRVGGTTRYDATTKAQITAQQDNYAIGAGYVFRLESDAARSITGIAGGANGRELLLQNFGSFTITLANESGSSTAANRIITGTGGDLGVASNETAALCYDSTTSRWRVSGKSGSAGVTGSGANTRVAFWSGASTLSSNAGFIFADAGSAYQFNVRLSSASTRSWAIVNSGAGDAASEAIVEGAGDAYFRCGLQAGGAYTGNPWAFGYEQTSNTFVLNTGTALTSPGQLQITPIGSVLFTQSASTGTVVSAFRIVDGTHTSLSADTEYISVDFDLDSTKQFVQSAGAFALQRAVVVRAPTYSATAATETITTAIGWDFNGPPIAGANVTLTNTYVARFYASNALTHPQVVIQQDSTGDAAQRFTLGTTRSWIIGVDNSNGDNFSINTAASGTVALAAAQGFSLDTTMALVLYGSTPQISTSASSSTSMGVVTTGNADCYLTAATTNAGAVADPKLYFQIAPAGSVEAGIGLDNSDADSFILFLSSAPGTNNILRAATANGTYSMRWTPLANTSGATTSWLHTAPAHTNQTLSTEVIDVDFDLDATLEHATGALATQRCMVIRGRTYSFVGASTLTNAVTLEVTNPPTAGANATITNAYAARFVHNDALTHPQIVCLQNSTGDAGIRLALGTTRSYILAIDNDASDALVIASAASGTAVAGTSDLLSISTAGDVGIGAAPTATVRLKLVTGSDIQLRLQRTTATANVWDFTVDSDGRVQIQDATGGTTPLIIGKAATGTLFITSRSNVLIGTTTDATANDGGILIFGDNAADPTLGASTGAIYGKAVAAVVEMFARDSGGASAQLTPHHDGLWAPLMTGGYDQPWKRYHVEKMIRFLERHFGESWIEEVANA